MKRIHLLVLPLLVSILLSGCLNRLPALSGSSALAVETVLPAHVVDEASKVELVLRQHARELTFELPLENESVSHVVDSLYEGTWEAELRIVDFEGDVIYRAVSEVLLFRDQTTLAKLDLVPAPGLLEVYIDLSNFQDKDSVGRARVSVTPGGYSSSIREEGSDIIRIEREVDPRTYDFRVSLYGEEYSNAIYNSPWQPVDIRPGKVTTVVWSVSKGDLQIVGNLHPAPGSPEALRAEPVENGKALRLTWAPGPNYEYATAFRIYQRSAPFDYYKMIQEVPSDTFEWVIDTSSLTTPHTRVYAVSAVSAMGSESLRSEPVEVTLPLIHQ